MAAPLEKAALLNEFEYEIPEPVVARRSQRGPRVRKALLHVFALVALVHIGRTVFSHGKQDHKHDHHHHHRKPKGPLRPDEAKELFL
jgi:hypothetical protein